MATKSALLSAQGKSFEILKAIIDPVLAKGGDDDDVEELLRNEELRGRVADVILRYGPKLFERIREVKVLLPSLQLPVYFCGLEDGPKFKVDCMNEWSTDLLTGRGGLLASSDFPDKPFKLKVYRLLHNIEMGGGHGFVLGKLAKLNSGRPKMSLAEIWLLLCLQPSGETGFLATDGKMTHFYISRDSRTFFAWIWYVHSHGWCFRCEEYFGITHLKKGDEFLSH